MEIKSDIEIAQSCEMKNIREIAATAGVDEKYLEMYDEKVPTKETKTEEPKTEASEEKTNEEEDASLLDCSLCAHTQGYSTNTEEDALSQLVLEGAKNIRVTSVGDGDSGHAEVLTAASAEVDAVALVVVHGGLGEHSVVLNLGLSQGRAVVGHENELS